MLNMVDSMMFYDRNKELYDLFDKYDRGELNEDQIKMNLNLPIMMKIKKSSLKKDIEDNSIENNLDM